MKSASEAALLSTCSRRQVGALVTRSGLVLAAGWNGVWSGLSCLEGGCARCSGTAPSGTALDECVCVHAEVRAIAQCARLGWSTLGAQLEVTVKPCLSCHKLAAAAGIARVVYVDDYPADYAELIPQYRIGG